MNKIASLSVVLLVMLGLAPSFASAEMAPDFSLKTLTGDNVRLAEQRGDIILINFWASWCGPCIQEMPKLDQLAEKYQGLGVQVWGINVETDTAAANAYLAKLPVTFPILFDSENNVSKAYAIKAMPTTVIINKDGEVSAVHHGYQSGYEKKYEADIKKLLRQ
ncbi:TlpA family protein disulfide reductase [Rheinheimera salexigens]|uniref:Redoxin n=1 Tax=Rheinheimera salexigens TaxID=1628148 RepID=A0A1E7Q8S3_9GAMM|nr:TlpA disulfide reductase family protein [Rheinheimera salexigens]OEY70501.1 redoxin [Rheinheimera salexigens]